LILFAGGSKSEKLSVAYEYFEAEAQGFMTREHMLVYLRSFLTILLALNKNALKMEAAEAQQMVETGAYAITQRVFEDTQHDGDYINFDEFKDWYNNGGFKLVPWLELLDLKKWELTTEDVPDSVPGTDEENNIVFDFDLLSPGFNLQIQQQDIDELQLILTKTGLHNVDVEQLCGAFQQYSEGGTLDKRSFDSCIREVVPSNELSDTDKGHLSHALSNIFYAFDRNGNGEVEVAEFASGFSLLGAGSKSDKLALAFQMFDTDEDGRLTRRQMWKYLRSFLIVLLKLSRGFQSMDEYIMDCATHGAVACTRMVFSQANLEVKTKISFEEFAAWYTDGGYTLIPWL